MNAQRFADLVAAYGAEPARWPAGERTAALAFAKANQQQTRALLDRERGLDRLLSLDGGVVADAASITHVADRAPRAASKRGGLLWSGIGFAGLGLAGAVAGALAVSVLTPLNVGPDDDGYALTAFGDGDQGEAP